MSQTSLSLPLVDFYGQPALFLDNSLLQNTPNRVYLTGTINLHSFEAVAEPWRDDQHILIIPRHLLRELWIDPGANVDLTFGIIPEPSKHQLPDKLKTIFKENPDYARAFAQLSESDQLQYLNWIHSAPSPGEQSTRIDKTIQHVRDLLHLGKSYSLI